MEIARLSEMIKGWFVGDFNPSVFPTTQFEVAIKEYKSGDRESCHIHKLATEITVILNGKVKMNGRVFQHGDIVTLSPGEETDFEALTDVMTVVVKSPSVKNDKYILER